jgi:hypothetical protein
VSQTYLVDVAVNDRFGNQTGRVARIDVHLPREWHPLLSLVAEDLRGPSYAEGEACVFIAAMPFTCRVSGRHVGSIAFDSLRMDAEQVCLLLDHLRNLSGWSLEEGEIALSDAYEAEEAITPEMLARAAA